MKQLDRKDLSSAANLLGDKDREYFYRMWDSPSDIYEKRLKAIGFENCRRVLDAGCGMGQWTRSLSQLNESVEAIDYSETRVKVTQQMTDILGMKNVKVDRQSIEQLNFETNSFDAIFCYATIMLTDFKKSLKEFSRVLSPGGKIYIQGGGLGCYIFQILESPNQSASYDSRQTGIDTINNTLSYFSLGRRNEGVQIVIPSELMKLEMEKVGFDEIIVGADGQIVIGAAETPKSFYPPNFKGIEHVYEVLAIKK